MEVKPTRAAPVCAPAQTRYVTYHGAMSDPAFRTLSEEDYLRTEETSSVKREYVDGFVYAQAGATNAHNLICSNIHFALYASARTKGCFVYQSDMKVKIRTVRGIKYYYPDIAVNCTPLSSETLYLIEPCLIVEVLSKGTHKIDESYKAEHYLSLNSLQAYLMVDARSRAAAIYRRTSEGWAYELVEDRVVLPCVDVELTLDDIYAAVPL